MFDVVDQFDVFIYDLMNLVFSVGGNVCCIGGVIDGGVFDQQELEVWQDILVYIILFLEEGMEISGFIEIIFYVFFDVKDIDFMVKFIDVYLDGWVYNLDEII